LKVTGIVKHLTGIILIVPFILASCASTGGPGVYAPEWYKSLVEGEKDGCYLIKFSGMGDAESDASRQASEELFGRILELSAASDSYSLPEDRDGMVDLIAAMIADDSQSLEPLGFIQRQEWVTGDDGIYYFGAFCMEKSASQWLESRLVERYYQEDEALQDILRRASALEGEGELYSAAEELVRAAAYISGRGIPLERKTAGAYIARAAALLERIEIRTTSVPARIFVNRRVEPFHLYCEAGDRPVPAVELLVQYQGRKRDGGPGQFERRLISNETGIVEFYHPFIPFSGNATVDFSPGSRDFRSTVAKLEENGLDVEALRNWTAGRRISHQLLVEAVDREIPTGVVILHADITGNSLELNDAASGVVEELSQAGFDVELMNLDPDEIVAAGEDSFLRDLKAAYKGDYDRVLFGVVGINDFEARTETFRVATSGYLRMADVETGEILLSLEQDKAVESRNDGLAVSASFRELGKAFAQELVSALD
jgi:hypothetical protein